MAIPISYNLRNLWVRKATTVMTALGVSLTVAVLLGIAALVGGLRSSLEVTGSPMHLIVKRQGATSELVSVVPQDKFQVVKFMEGIAQLDGEPMVSHEVITVVNLKLRADTTQDANVNVRGVSPMGIKMREGMRLQSGRWFETGKREVIVGRGTNAAREGTSIGDKVEFGRGEWEVVGVFDAGPSAFNSEIWGDGNFITSDLGRGNSRSSVLVRARDEVTLTALKNRMSDDQRLQLEAETEREYYAQQMSSAQPVEMLGMVVAIIMAVGSSFAAMNTMYTAVARRAREIGVLRMLGFSRGSILTSFLIESLLLSLLGGAFGCLLAVLLIHGRQGRIGNFVTFSETTFNFEVTPAILAIGLAFAIIMGVLGGLLPARMAAKSDILSSIRDT